MQTYYYWYNLYKMIPIYRQVFMLCLDSISSVNLVDYCFWLQNMPLNNIIRIIW